MTHKEPATSDRAIDSTVYGTSEVFDQNARRALIDPQLRSALRHLAVTFGEKRALAIASVDDWEGLRERARAIKDETLAHLDQYLEDVLTAKARADLAKAAVQEKSEALQKLLNNHEAMRARASEATSVLAMNTMRKFAGMPVWDCGMQK